ncbi:unnamed protein product [Rhodiola kirilowii]
MSLNPNTLGHLSLMHRKFEKFKVVLPIPASKILFRTIMRQNVTCRKSDNNSKSSSEVALKKGPWTPEEDIILVSYVQQHGASNWRSVPAKTGLLRCSKSCRLRWTNYLRPGIKRGNFTEQEQKMIIHLKALLGNSPSGTVQKASGFNPAAKVAVSSRLFPGWEAVVSIRKGNFLILDVTDPAKLKEKEKDKYTDADYKALQQNARAKKVLYMALSPGYQVKMTVYKTAKEQWDGLARLYEGNEDIKRNRILAATKDYESVEQRKDESLDDFYTRFQVIVTQLNSLDEILPQWKVTHQFMQALGSRWDTVTTALQAQKGIKDITLEELVANLQSQARITERKMARRQAGKSQAIALKVEKALDIAQVSLPTKGEDEEIALLSRAFKMANTGRTQNRGISGGGRNNQRWNKGSASEEGKTKVGEKEERTCYHCQKKGHLAKDCYSKKKGEPPTPKEAQAMFAAWGDSDEEQSDRNESDFAETIAELLKKITSLKEQIEVMKDEHEDDLENNRLWSTKAMRLEREMEEHICKCPTCDRRDTQISDLSDRLRSLRVDDTRRVGSITESDRFQLDNEELRQTVTDLRQKESERKKVWLRELEAKKVEEAKQDYKRKFTRPELGYVEEMKKTDEDAANRRMAKGKGPMTEVGEGSHQQRKLEPTRQSGRVASSPKESYLHDSDSGPFKAGKAFEIWKKMSSNRQPFSIDPQAQRRIPAHVEKHKKTGTPYYRVCWHYGHSGHYRADCEEWKEANEKNHKKAGTAPIPRRKAPPHIRENRAKWVHPHHDTAIHGRPRRTPRRKINLTDDNDSRPSKFPSADGVRSKPWYLDSGCSKHMMGDPGWFISLQAYSGDNIIFENKSSGKVVATGEIYTVDPEFVPDGELCLSSITDDTLLWHKRFGHASTKLIHKLHQNELVVSLPKVESSFDQVCSTCATGKQVRTSFKSKQSVSTSGPLDMIHMDLYGPVNVVSRGGNRYILVIVDDYSRFTWTIFLTSKDETYPEFVSWLKLIENKLSKKLASIRTDNETEFRNSQFISLCRSTGIDHNFSAPRTPQQNGVVERKNRTLEDMSRTMLIASGVPKGFWAEAVHVASYILNRASLRFLIGKTPYELLRGRKPNITHLKVFGYPSHSRAYTVYNLRLEWVEESIHVTFDDRAMTGHLVKDPSSQDDGELQLTDRTDPDWEPTQSEITEPVPEVVQAAAQECAEPAEAAQTEILAEGQSPEPQVIAVNADPPNEEVMVNHPPPAGTAAEPRTTRSGRVTQPPT